MKVELNELTHGRRIARVTLAAGERLPMLYSTKGSYAGPGVVEFVSYGDGGVDTADAGVRQSPRRADDSLPENVRKHLFGRLTTTKENAE